MSLPAAIPNTTGSAVLDDIASVIGMEAALLFAEQFAGERVYIPKDPATNPRIASAIGDELSARLCDALYRTVVSIPIRLVRERRVAALIGQGKSKAEIGRALCITERQVYRIMERLRGGA